LWKQIISPSTLKFFEQHSRFKIFNNGEQPVYIASSRLSKKDLFGLTKFGWSKSVCIGAFIVPPLLHLVEGNYILSAAWVIVSVCVYYAVFRIQLSRKALQLISWMVGALIAMAYLASSALPAHAIFFDTITNGITAAIALIPGAQNFANAINGGLKVIAYVLFGVIGIYGLTRKNSEEEEKAKMWNRAGGILITGFLFDTIMLLFGLA
jgi:hypothetical protein